MRWIVQAAAVAGLVAVGAGLVALRVNENAGGPAAETATSPGATPAPPEAPQPVEPARVVADELVASPQVAPEQLVRVAPREPLSRFSRPMPVRPQKRKDGGRLYRPVVMDAGTVVGSGIVVTIAGIVVTPEKERCTDAAGTEWPCGIRARTALRSFVRGRALACDLPDEITEQAYTVACRLGKADVGRWLVEQGWAKASPDGPYEEMGRAARTELRGIFAAAPSVEPVPGIQIPPAPETGTVADIMAPADAAAPGALSSSIRP